jgi:hypothetical protein
MKLTLYLLTGSMLLWALAASAQDDCKGKDKDSYKIPGLDGGAGTAQDLDRCPAGVAGLGVIVYLLG